MRLPFLGFALLSLASHAQQPVSNPFEDGYYVLADGHSRQSAQLKLKGTDLLVKTVEGKRLRFTPIQVASCQIGATRYKVVRAYEVVAGELGGEAAKLVERRDSGRVELLGGIYSVTYAPAIVGGNGMMMGGGTDKYVFYLLRAAPASRYTPVYGSNKQFREAMRPFLADRPDLLQLLDEKRIDENNLPAVVRALNTNSPFTPSTN